MKFEELFEDIIVSLGGNLVDIELEERDVRVAFRRAKRTFQQKGPDNSRRRFLKLPVTKGVQEYQIPSEISTVVKLIRPAMAMDVSDMGEFALAAYQNLFSRAGTGSQGYDYLTNELEKQLSDIYRRHANFDVQFDHDKHRNIITMLKTPDSNQNWIVECYASLQDEEYMDMYWIQEWTLAEAKEMLGQAYRKFSSLPGPEGNISLGGSEMIQEAGRRKEELLEDILNQVSGDPDFYEITMG